MASFGSTVFSDGADEWLQVANEEWVRQLSMSNNWTHIRIGVLFAITGTANIATSNGFAIGICSGTSHPFGDAACTNFVGAYFNNGLQSWTSNAPNPYYAFASANGGLLVPTSKVGGVITSGATNLPDSAGWALPTTSGTARRGIAYVDIIKGNPSYTVGMSFNTTANISTDFTVPFLLSGMTQTMDAITVNGIALSPGNHASTVTASEAAGPLDTIDIYSNLVANPMQIYEVAIQKLG